MAGPTPQFPWSDAALAAHLREAVQSYWTARGGQSERQREGGSVDAGTRGEVTGGQHLNAFVKLLCELIRSAGFAESEIAFKTGVELPGYYRPLKKWDIVVIREGRLCAAMEMKSQVGPSFGNNFNNRSEEAIGSSTDFWVAYREGALGAHQPWLGYFLMVEDTLRSTSTVRLAKAVFEPMPIFRDTSYMQRYGILCQRLVLERNYNAASLLASPRGTDGTYSEPVPALAFLSFAKSLFGHLIGAA
jgi:hypothetical protein